MINLSQKDLESIKAFQGIVAEVTPFFLSHGIQVWTNWNLFADVPYANVTLLTHHGDTYHTVSPNTFIWNKGLGDFIQWLDARVAEVSAIDLSVKEVSPEEYSAHEYVKSTVKY